MPLAQPLVQSPEKDRNKLGSGTVIEIDMSLARGIERKSSIKNYIAGCSVLHTR